jgi:DNA-binding transcriptional MocR family regulator
MTPPPSTTTVDLTRATPPFTDELGLGFRSALAALSNHPEIDHLFRSNRIGGNDRDRDTAAPWLAQRLGYAPDSARVIVGNGTQNLLSLVLRQVVGRGGTIVAEALTHPLVPPIADELDVNVVPVAIDDDGIMPEALDFACVTYRPKLIYCNPTGHNPTASVMSDDRRRTIADIARKHHLTILEDDVLGSLRIGGPKPIASHAPDLTWYIQSLSKCLALGFRVAYLVVPEMFDRDFLVRPMSMRSSWFASAIAIELANTLFHSGIMSEVTRSMSAEASLRRQAAEDILSEYDLTTAQGALHVWLKVPAPWQAQTFTKACADAGVLVRPSEMFLANPKFWPPARAPDAIRIAITAPPTVELLQSGLNRIRSVLQAAHIVMEGAT